MSKQKKHVYRTSDINELRLQELIPLLVGGCIVALDIAKTNLVFAVATVTGDVVKLFRFEHPTQTRAFLAVVTGLQAGMEKLGLTLKVAMEPTGTYGDALRYQLNIRKVPVHMVSPKRTHDSQAMFDNVPSLHDPKSAALVAKLCGLGLASEWKPPAEIRTRLRPLIEQRAHEQAQYEACLGRQEALLARHWPEFGRWLDARSQVSAARLLSEYGAPARVSGCEQEVKEFLQRASRGRLSVETIEGAVKDARETLGVPMVAEEEGYLRELATQALAAQRRMDALEEQMKTIARDDEAFAQLQPWMGAYTAAVMVTLCDPRQYGCAKELEKACGLNLREKSSGEHQGRLSITKRGPSLVRQVLFMFALRLLNESPTVHAWYVKRRGYTEQSKLSAVVAVMRKLTKALFHVARGNKFDASKLFDERRLEITKVAAPKRAPVARTTPRSTVRREKKTPAKTPV